MKIFVFPVIVGGFAITFILQGIQFSSQNLKLNEIKSETEALRKEVQVLTKNLDNLTLRIEKISINNIAPPKSDLAQLDGLLSPEVLSQTLGATTSKSVTVKSQWDKVDVYESSKLNSKVVGQATSGQNLPVITSNNGWYQVTLKENLSGWIQNTFVNESN